MSAYHKADLERLRIDNEWIKAFYKHGYENHDKTVSMINEVLSWRNEFEANSNNKYFFTFPCNRDVCQKKVFF